MSDSRKSISGKYPLSDEADPPPNYVDGADNLVKPQRRPDQQQPRLLVPNSPFIHMSTAQRQDQQQAQQLQLSQGAIERGQEINTMISQFTALWPTPEMLPHFLSVEMKGGDAGAEGIMKMNPARIQCPSCKEWFFSAEARRIHKIDLPLDCIECGMCFRDAIHHVQQASHTRCFLSGCGAFERHSYGHRASDIKAHVEKFHRS